MPKTESYKTCPCGKRGFRSERSAERALGRAQAKRDRIMTDSRRGLHRENRFYHCDWSDLYHLTSMSARAQQLIAA